MAELKCVGFQGALGAFSEEAVRALVPEGEPIPRQSFQEVVRAVESGEDNAGVVPIENTLAGTVAESYEVLAESELFVIREIAIPIRHCLLGVPGATLGGVLEARSHPVALSQCREFFASRPEVRPHAVYDTAGAAEEVAAAGDLSLAAIASEGAGKRYGLDLLQGDLQDRDDNQTRFFLIVREAHDFEPSELLKTALVAELENRPGALHELLGIFASRSLDLTHITSRPATSPWTYRFLLEFRHSRINDGAMATEAASELCARLRVLGTFPAWQPKSPQADEVTGLGSEG